VNLCFLLPHGDTTCNRAFARRRAGAALYASAQVAQGRGAMPGTRSVAISHRVSIGPTSSGAWTEDDADDDEIPARRSGGCGAGSTGTAGEAAAGEERDEDDAPDNEMDHNPLLDDVAELICGLAKVCPKPRWVTGARSGTCKTGGQHVLQGGHAVAMFFPLISLFLIMLPRPAGFWCSSFHALLLGFFRGNPSLRGQRPLQR